MIKKNLSPKGLIFIFILIEVKQPVTIKKPIGLLFSKKPPELILFVHKHHICNDKLLSYHVTLI